MIKRKVEKIEDAEIIASKEEKYDDSFVVRKINKLRLQFIMFFIFVFIAFVMTLGALIYNQYNRSEVILRLQKELEALNPLVSFEFIDNALNDSELEIQKETINLIDKAVKNLEEVFEDRLNSVTNFGDNREVIKLFEDELLKLQLKLDKKISEVNKINNETSRAFLSQGRVSAQTQTILDRFDLKVQRKFDILNDKLTQIEKEFSLSKNKLLDAELSILDKSKQILSINLESFSELEESFVKISYNALKMEAQRSIGGNRWFKPVTTLKSLFVFRSTEPKEGNTLDAILSRAEYMLSLKDFEGCLNELDTLDEVSLGLFSEWMEKITLLINTTN